MTQTQSRSKDRDDPQLVGRPPLQLPEVHRHQHRLADGDTLPTPELSGVLGAGGEDVPPQLSWSGYPEGTRSSP